MKPLTDIIFLLFIYAVKTVRPPVDRLAMAVTFPE